MAVISKTRNLSLTACLLPALDPSLVATGLEQDGQDPPVAGQVASLTSKNNLSVSFCYLDGRILSQSATDFLSFHQHEFLRGTNHHEWATNQNGFMQPGPDG